MQVFLCDFEAAINFPGEARVFAYDVCDPGAYVVHVAIRKDYDAHGRLSREYLRYTVRDRGIVGHKNATKAIAVVRRVAGVTPLGDDYGKLLGYLQSAVGQYEYYVFEVRARPPTRNSAEETTSPRLAKVPSTPESRKDPAACTCVFDGPSASCAAHPRSSQTVAAEKPPCDWEFPDARRASGE